MTKFGGRHVAPLIQSSSSNVQPPPHWLAMVQEQAPHLLDLNGPFSIELPTDPVNSGKLSTTTPNKSSTGFIRLSLFQLGEWLLRLGHMLTDGQYLKSNTYSFESKANPRRDNSEPPDHWLAMVQSQTLSSLNSKESLAVLRNNKNFSNGPKETATIEKPVLFQNSGSRADNSNDDQTMQVSFGAVRSVNGDAGNLSGSSDDVDLDKTSVVSPNKLSMENFSWPMIKFRKRLLRLSRAFTSKRHGMVNRDCLRSVDVKQGSIQSRNQSRNKVEIVDNTLKTSSFRLNELLMSIASLKLKRLGPMNFSLSLVRLGRWLLSLGRIFVVRRHSVVNASDFKDDYCRQRYTDEQSDHQVSPGDVTTVQKIAKLYSIQNSDIQYDDASSRQHVQLERGLGHKVHGDADKFPDRFAHGNDANSDALLSAPQMQLNINDFSWSLDKFGKWLLSLGRIFVARQHTVSHFSNLKKEYCRKRYNHRQPFSEMESEGNCKTLNSAENAGLKFDTGSEETIRSSRKSSRKIHANPKELKAGYYQQQQYPDPFHDQIGSGGDDVVASSMQKISDVSFGHPISDAHNSRTDNGQDNRSSRSDDLADIKCSTSLRSPAHWLSMVRKKLPHFLVSPSVSRNVSKNVEVHPDSVGVISPDETQSLSLNYSSVSYDDIIQDTASQSPSKATDNKMGEHRAKHRYSDASFMTNTLSRVRPSVADARFDHIEGKVSRSWPHESTFTSSSFTSSSEVERVQMTTWPTLNGEEDSAEGDGQERAKIKELVEDCRWPELASNLVRDSSNSSPETATFSALLATNSTTLSKVIDTTKERKQRELIGALWNA